MKYKGILVMVVLISLISCTGVTKKSGNNTFYIEYKTNNDTLKNILLNATSGKVSYFDKSKKFQIIPVSYLTEEFESAHYYKIVDESIRPAENNIKYEITFSGRLLTDSTYYSIKKYKYKNGSWEPKSDMGAIKAHSNITGIHRKEYFDKKELGKIVINTIARDTYSE